LFTHVAQVLKEAKQLYSQGARPSASIPVVEGMDEDTQRCLCVLEEALRQKRKQEVMSRHTSHLTPHTSHPTLRMPPVT
jgi:hypothetical protein